MATPTNPAARFTCPLCCKSVKVTKNGKVARHGYNRFMGGGEFNRCATGGLATTPALERAVDVLVNYRTELESRIAAGKKVGWNKGVVKQVINDIAKVRAVLAG